MLRCDALEPCRQRSRENVRRLGAPARLSAVREANVLGATRAASGRERPSERFPAWRPRRNAACVRPDAQHGGCEKPPLTGLSATTRGYGPAENPPRPGPPLLPCAIYSVCKS